MFGQVHVSICIEKMIQNTSAISSCINRNSLGFGVLDSMSVRARHSPQSWNPLSPYEYCFPALHNTSWLQIVIWFKISKNVLSCYSTACISVVPSRTFEQKKETIQTQVWKSKQSNMPTLLGPHLDYRLSLKYFLRCNWSSIRPFKCVI